MKGVEIMPSFNKNLLEEMKRDTEEKAKIALSDDERVQDLYQGKRTEEIINKFLDGKSVVENISPDLLDDNPNNHFHRIEGDKWDEFVGSIKEFGVITPLIVRKAPSGRYEILAGHNRKYGAIEAGLKEVPCIVTDVDDVDASVIVGITNNQREETTDLEWGWSYRTTYEALKKAVGRPKEKDENNVPSVGTLSSEDNVPSVGTLNQKGRTVDIVAQKYGVGKGTIQNKIRLTYLTEQLYGALVKAKAPQGVMVDLSYLTPVDQANLAAEIAWEGLIVTEELAKSLKAMASEKNGENIGIDNLCAFVSANGENKEKAPSRPKKYLVDESLFPKSIKKQDRESYITKALLYILNNEISLEE